VALTSGEYAVRTKLRVVVWRAPDADGDGAEVWTDELDNQGRQIGKSAAKDKTGKPVKSYSPPEGFENRPGYDHTDNYVLVKGREVVRQPNGEAICIRPGTALVFNPDGSVETLTDEYAQYVFDESHDAADVAETPVETADEVSARELRVRDERAAALRAELASLESVG